jgi:hypothetical protein
MARFSKKVTECENRVFDFLYKIYLKDFKYSKKNSVNCCHKYENVFIYFNDTSFLDRFSTKSEISSFIKIRLVRAELFHANRQTDRWMDETKLIVSFRNFTYAPKK